MYVDQLSYTRLCAYEHNREHRLLPFVGSSLCRTNSKKEKKKTNKKTAKKIILSVDGNGELQQEIDGLCTDKATQPGAGKGASRVRVRSSRTSSKIKNKAFAFIDAYSDTTINFLTLSFINRTTDTNGARCLNKFLTMMRKRYGKFAYMWVAEHQKNGNIHFHFLMNIYIDLKYFNSLWVLQQYNDGIAHTRYSYEEIIKRHSAGTMQEILNPLDIEEVKNLDAASGYLSKYLSKDANEFTCATWHCSREVSRTFTAMNNAPVEAIQFVFDELENISVNKKTGEVFTPKTYKTDRAIIRYIYNKDKGKEFLSNMRVLNRWILDGMEYSKCPEIIKEFLKEYPVKLN